MKNNLHNLEPLIKEILFNNKNHQIKIAIKTKKDLHEIVSILRKYDCDAVEEIEERKVGPGWFLYIQGQSSTIYDYITILNVQVDDNPIRFVNSSFKELI